MRVKSPLRLTVFILILVMLIYTGYKGAVSLITGEPIDFAIISRSGVKSVKNVQNFVVAGTDEDGVRTDLILFCQYNLSDNSINVLQIPRDTKVDNDRYDKKINSAYGTKGKTETLFNEIEQVIGIRPEKYVVISFKAFRELIDAIGGVSINVPIRMYYTDPVQNLTIDLYPGEQTLDGRHAEMFMRFRENNDGTGYRNGDVDRIAAQRTFYAAVMDKLTSGSVVLKVPQILSIINKNVKTDFTGKEIAKYMGQIPKFSLDKVNIVSLPGEGRYEGKVSYFFCDKEKTKSLIEQNFVKASGLGSEKINVSPVKNRFIKVKIIDATSIDGEQMNVSEVVGETLEEQGFRVVASEKAERIRDNSVLINHNSKLAAKEVQKAYPNVEIFKDIEKYEQSEGAAKADVTLIVGNDFAF